MKKIAILFSGNGSNMEYILDTIHGKKCQVVKVLTDNPTANGINIAKKHGVPLDIVDPTYYKTREDFDKKIVELLQKCQAQLTVLAGFMRILTPAFTNTIEAINLHPSLLPRHKGLNAIEKSYADVYPYGGVTVHYVSSELDAGATIVQGKITKADLSLDEYTNAVHALEKKLLIEAILDILNR